MLKALYDYAVENRLALPPGYVNKTVKAYISLSAEGDFIGFVLDETNEAIPCPDIGSLANGTDKCNILVEKRSVILSAEPNRKSDFFRKTLKDACAFEPALGICLKALTDEHTSERIFREADAHRIKPSDRISFMVDGVSVLKSKHVPTWWQEYRRQLINAESARKSLCLITGEPTVPMRTVPPINGLKLVGGHGRGDALICFDKPAFCSYELRQAANAPVSEEAYAAVKAALDALIAKAPILAGMKFVHWYDKPIPTQNDPIKNIFAGFSDENDEDEADDEQNEADAESARITAQNTADRLINSVESGSTAPPLASTYYMLVLSGVNGRVMIRRWEHGSYEALQQNVNQWYADIALANLSGTGMVKPYKLTARMIRLLSKQRNDARILDRLSSELSGIAPAILTAIIGGGQFPDTVASRTLSYIRSQMMESNDDAKSPQVPDSICCQWLKAWILRKNKEDKLMTCYNSEHPSAAYHCGAVMAVYAAIQKQAMHDVNASIIQRYYAAASQTPALVIGRLGMLSNYHLDKIEWHWAVSMLTEMLNTAYCGIGDTVPVTLDLEQQAYFALGYRQMTVELNRRINEKTAESNAKKMQKKANMNTEEENE